MKKVFSLILVICMTVVVCVPSAFAEDSQTVPLETVSFEDAGIEAGASTGANQSQDESQVSPRIVVSEGTNAFISRITVYPAMLDNGEVKYAPSVYFNATFPEGRTGGTLRASPAVTTSKLNEFAKVAGRPAELFYMEVHYDVINDRWGSYGKYFEFTPTGNLIFPDKTSSGTVKYDLPRTNVDTGYSLFSVFTIPQNTTEQYQIGLNGGFWYYSVKANKILNHSAHASAFFNSTI